MTLSDDQVKEYILNPQNKDIIDFQIKLKEKHDLHINGLGLDKFLEKVDHVENQQYVEVKKNLSNTITVKAYEKVLRPKDKILTAKGGSVIYEFDSDDDKKNEEKLKSILSNLKYKGHSLESYTYEMWLDYGIWIDPMGITLVGYVIEETNDILEGKKVEVTEDLTLEYISVYTRTTEGKFYNFHDFDYTSFDKLEYLILNEGENEDGDSLYRVIDDETDSIWIWKKSENKEEPDQIKQIEDSVFEHGFGKVPAVFNSNRIDKKSINRWFTTYCSESLVIAKDYLNDYTDFRIYKKKLGIPRMWEFKFICETCQGQGTILNPAFNVANDNKSKQYITCGSCGGSKGAERTLTDILKLEVLGPDSQSNVPPAGSVTLPTEIQEQLRKELDMMEFDLAEIVWGQGSAVDKERRNTTAFEVSVRNEGKIDKLRRIERNKVLWQTAIIDLFGNAIFKENYQGVIITPATQFIMLTPTESRQVYLDSKKANSSEPQLTKLWFDYLTAEYESDPQGYERQVKVFLLTPMFHSDIISARDYLTDIEFIIKKNLANYIYRYEHEEKKSLLSESVSDINKQFVIYANQETKIKEDVTSQE